MSQSVALSLPLTDACRWWNAIFFGVALLAFLFLYEESKFSNTEIGVSVPLSNFEGPPTESNELPKTDTKESSPKGIVVTASDTPSDIEVGTSRAVDPTHTHINPNIHQKTYWQRLAITTISPGPFNHFARHAWQPIQILFTVPAVAFMSLIYGVMLVWTTVMVTVLSSWMALPPYNFNASSIGLMSLPSFIGTTLGTLIAAPLSDALILYLSRRNNGIYEPEMRLWVMVPFIPFVPAGAFMFGFGLADGSSWVLIAVGYALCNFGTSPISSVALTYLTDSYTEVISHSLRPASCKTLIYGRQIVADALVSVTFTRNALSTIFVFAVSPWIANVGMKNVFITINVLGTVVFMGIFGFIYYGKSMRAMTARRYRHYAERQFEARQV